ncbi:recombinase family protein [Maritimibacter sp. DP07]|uniref:Recombinase family protein n=1 Tax=Maritimibacter harenae TaxID=2606218 RepID=A0A845LXB2_9RHOB|nr:recombinase family protein [Maritimibacter harenae]MZR11419.1 recombinase family protein [Maritimibacter harenae]
MSIVTTRCAIYTRKSSDEGLDQDFNSLDAQHEACAAYIASQRHEGWKMLPHRYDDGGISGGTLERPGLQQLLANIDAGRVDMVVVYKIDRLTRSLSDFAKLVDRFEAAGCSFVSVTQAFNTSSSMGRLTLNVLLSFAQFEREVTAERIRDKIAASKKKGLWMGGLAPMGYDPHSDPNRRELVVNPDEARSIQRIFELYLRHGCLNATARAAEADGLRSKRRVFASGRVQGGGYLSRGQIHQILTNPVYRGLIRHKDKTWPGQHEAIVEASLWEEVQHRLVATSARRRGTITKTSKQSATGAAPLLGKFRDETGDMLTPTHTQRHDKRLRYYVSNRLLNGRGDQHGWRLPAPALEMAVANAIADHFFAAAHHHKILHAGSAGDALLVATKVNALAQRVQTEGVRSAPGLIEQGSVEPGRIQITLNSAALARELDRVVEDLDPTLSRVETAFTCKRRGVELKLVAGDRETTPDTTLLRGLRAAHRWADLLKAGTSLRRIATEANVTESYVRRIVPLATLSPKIQDAIVRGTQPVDLTLERLVRDRLPLRFHDQEEMLGLR